MQYTRRTGKRPFSPDTGTLTCTGGVTTNDMTMLQYQKNGAGRGTCRSDPGFHTTPHYGTKASWGLSRFTVQERPITRFGVGIIVRADPAPDVRVRHRRT